MPKIPSKQENYIQKTNIPNEQFTLFSLSKNGYGAVDYLNNMDIDILLNIIEFENIRNDIEEYESSRTNR